MALDQSNDLSFESKGEGGRQDGRKSTIAIVKQEEGGGYDTKE